MFSNRLDKEPFPRVQSDPPLAQLCAVPVCPAISSQGAETVTSLSVAAESCEVTSQSSLLSTGQPKGPQPLPIRHALQPFYWLCCLPHGCFQVLSHPLYIVNPELHTLFKVRLHQQ